MTINKTDLLCAHIKRSGDRCPQKALWQVDAVPGWYCSVHAKKRAADHDSSARSLTAFVEHASNSLGWSPPPTRDGSTQPLWRSFALEASKVRKTILAHAPATTIRELDTTVEWLFQQRRTVKGPVGVVYHVDEAMKSADTYTVSDIGQAIDRAIAIEQAAQQPGWGEWVGRLRRCFGPARTLVYDEWKAART